MSRSTKKAAPKKAAKKTTPKAAPSASAKAGSSREPSPKPVAADGVKLARLRRLARAGFEGADLCPLLGIPLDVGPRANRWFNPLAVGDSLVMSALAVAIVDSGISPEVLERAAAKSARLRERGAK